MDKKTTEISVVIKLLFSLFSKNFFDFFSNTLAFLIG